MYNTFDPDLPKPQHTIKGKKRRRWWPGMGRQLAQNLKPGEPHFVCELCKIPFKLTYMRVHTGDLQTPDRNLCQDCYKLAIAY